MTSYRPLSELAGPLYGKEPWPLKFFTHDFSARCHNTLACSMIYDGREFGTRRAELGGFVDHPSGPPRSVSWKDNWHGRHSVSPEDNRTFPGPVELNWTSLDGDEHALAVDLDALFKERLVLHATPKDRIVPNWLETCSVQPVVPSVLVEIDDRTARVYMRATLITFRDNPPPGGAPTGTHSDLMLAWERTY